MLNRTVHNNSEGRANGATAHSELGGYRAKVQVLEHKIVPNSQNLELSCFLFVVDEGISLSGGQNPLASAALLQGLILTWSPFSSHIVPHDVDLGIRVGL